MTNYNLNISCSEPVPATITVKEFDTVTFKNKTAASVELTFTDGDAFKPKKTKTCLDPGDFETLTISGDKKKTKYKWKCPAKPELDTRTGTIDPS